jgi:hypothetical protein
VTSRLKEKSRNFQTSKDNEKKAAGKKIPASGETKDGSLKDGGLQGNG